MDARHCQDKEEMKSPGERDWLGSREKSVLGLDFVYLFIAHAFLWPLKLFAVLDFYRQRCLFKEFVSGSVGRGGKRAQAILVPRAV